jgi:bifunctional ADP-heptose synthase (sugar kinase/adenylyltransferase)
MSILIIGESCLDVFKYCSADRLCPDIPVPVLQIEKEITNPGMAQNVYNNIQKLTDDCDIFTNNNWKSIKKTRYIDGKSNHMFIRVDDDHSCIKRADIKSIDLESYDFIAVSDYNKGYLEVDDIEYICSCHPLVFLDTKKKVGEWAKEAAFIKINEYELQRSEDTLTTAVRDKIICTKGAKGCEYHNQKYPVTKLNVKDSCGAGDTFFAALVFKYRQSKDISLSIEYANLCASRVVGQKGVVTL